MPLRQYVYFALSSSRTTAQEMTAWLGIEPDETTVRGSRRADSPPLPVTHRWKVVCREPGLSVDELVARVLDRLGPHTDRIAELAARLAAEDEEYGSAVLEVVRYFNDDEATHGAAATVQPNLFGWHLDPDVLRFLAATGAALDVDEYDMTPD
ncbi:DUF4279 domain-containing protein [Streptomyces sp. NPDC046984]|uniref:DUF4279 domain-containing protein n=1 Tax=Streptomyces sp. NPDC046984 TaxID=3155138 RepID=UPI0033CDAC33